MYKRIRASMDCKSSLLARSKTTTWTSTRRRSFRNALLSLLFIIFMAHCLNDALDTLLHPQCTDSNPGTELMSHLQTINLNVSPNDEMPDISQAIRSHLNKACATSPWLSFYKGVHAVRLLRVEAPNKPHAGTPVRLKCVYETKGDKLQSLSWYKDGHEFYRYQPYERSKQVLIFNQTGVTVDLSRSKNNAIVLTNTTTETSGRYKCEVTVNTFQEANMATTLEFQTASSSSTYPPALLASVLPPLISLMIQIFFQHRI